MLPSALYLPGKTDNQTDLLSFGERVSLQLNLTPVSLVALQELRHLAGLFLLSDYYKARV